MRGNNKLIKESENKEIEYELQDNTRFHQIGQKYQISRKVLKNFEKLQKKRVDEDMNIHISNMYWTAEQELNDIMYCKEQLEECEKIIIERGKDNKEVDIERELDHLKIKMGAANYIIDKSKTLIYRIYDNTYLCGGYLRVEDILDLCELYQLIDTASKEAETVNTKLFHLDFDELSNERLERHFVLEWQRELYYQVEYIQIQIINIIGITIKQNQLSTDEKSLNVEQLFSHIINRNNYWPVDF